MKIRRFILSALTGGAAFVLLPTVNAEWEYDHRSSMDEMSCAILLAPKDGEKAATRLIEAYARAVDEYRKSVGNERFAETLRDALAKDAFYALPEVFGAEAVTALLRRIGDARIRTESTAELGIDPEAMDAKVRALLKRELKKYASSSAAVKKAVRERAREKEIVPVKVADLPGGAYVLQLTEKGDELLAVDLAFEVHRYSLANPGSPPTPSRSLKGITSGKSWNYRFLSDRRTLLWFDPKLTGLLKIDLASDAVLKIPARLDGDELLLASRLTTDERFFIYSTSRGRVVSVEIATGEIRELRKLPIEEVAHSALSSDGKTAVLAVVSKTDPLKAVLEIIEMDPVYGEGLISRMREFRSPPKNVRRIPIALKDILELRFAPDDQNLIRIDGDRKIFRHDLTQSGTFKIGDLERSGYVTGNLQISGDGAFGIVGGRDTPLYVNFRTGGMVSLPKLSGNAHRSLISPDGDSVLFYVSDGSLQKVDISGLRSR